MDSKTRKYCPYCGKTVTAKAEGNQLRDYCEHCGMYFYDNPLPVVSNIVMHDRNILLVKRENDPYKGYWCLPMGFAESGESIETAALRELHEEAGIKGKITGFVDVESGHSETYGDLLFVTFETEWISGKVTPGDDASEAEFFPLNRLPRLAFRANVNAIQTYTGNKQEYWAIIDSFKLSAKGHEPGIAISGFLSDKLIRLIEKNAEVISNRWFEDVSGNRSTPTYSKLARETSFERNKKVIRQFGKWLGGTYSSEEIMDFYTGLGADRKAEGFALSEVLSALSLTRKHVWEFALSQGMWSKTIDIYMTLELERRMMLFFDKASFYVAKGFEKE